MALDFAATYKVLVLGDSNVGKTCIVHRYCDERYYDTYISTIGESLYPYFSLLFFFFKYKFSILFSIKNNLENLIVVVLALLL